MKKRKLKYKNIEKENLVPDSVLNGARAEMQNMQQDKSVIKNKAPKWGYVWASIVCVLVVLIATPFFVLNNKEANVNNGIYQYNNLTQNEIISIDEFNNLNGTEYKYLRAFPSNYYEYKSKKKSVMLSQEVIEKTKSINLWIMSENISVDIFADYKNLKKKEPLKEFFFLYEITNNEAKVSLFYLGNCYYLLFDGYNFEELKIVMEDLIK